MLIYSCILAFLHNNNTFTTKVLSHHVYYNDSLPKCQPEYSSVALSRVVNTVTKWFHKLWNDNLLRITFWGIDLHIWFRSTIKYLTSTNSISSHNFLLLITNGTLNGTTLSSCFIFRARPITWFMYLHLDLVKNVYNLYSCIAYLNKLFDFFYS